MHYSLLCVNIDIGSKYFSSILWHKKLNYFFTRHNFYEQNGVLHAQAKSKLENSDWTTFLSCNKRIGNKICCIIFYGKDFLRHECRCHANFLLALSLFHWSFFAAIYMLYVFRQGIVFVSIVNTTVFAKQTIAQKSIRLR